MLVKMKIRNILIYGLVEAAFSGRDAAFIKAKMTIIIPNIMKFHAPFKPNHIPHNSIHIPIMPLINPDQYFWLEKYAIKPNTIAAIPNIIKFHVAERFGINPEIKNHTPINKVIHTDHMVTSISYRLIILMIIINYLYFDTDKLLPDIIPFRKL